MDSQEVEMLMDTATRWFGAHADQVAAADTGPGGGVVWQAYADLGWLALTLPEAAGGIGADTRAALRLVRLAGRALATPPLELHLMLAPWLVRAGGPDASAWADALASGAMRLGVADAGGQAEVNDAGCVTMPPTEVYGGATATHILVIGRNQAPSGSGAASRSASGHPSTDKPADTGRECVVLLPVDAPGVSCTPARWLDGRPCTRLSTNGAPAIALGGLSAPDLARELRQRASAALAADAAGAFEAAFDMTLDYLKQRVQFGKPLSALQAVQHGMADIFCDLQQLFALVERLGLEDGNGDGFDAKTVAATKSQLARRALRGVGGLIQLSGGIGVTDEYRLGRYYKRLHVAATLFGTAEQALAELDVRESLVPA